MDHQLVAEVLTSDSDEIVDLKANMDRLEGFIDLIRKIDALPDIHKRFFEESRSLYQTTAVNQKITDLENILSEFFGPAVKPADKALPRKLRKSSVVKYMGGIQKDQSLFTMELKTGQFYGALWPWRRNKAKIEIHLGYCSDWMSDEDYSQLETLVKQTVSHGAFKSMNADIGGQIHGISLPSFLQMAEMEKSSFTLRVTARHRVGTLHLSEGNLFAAEFDNSKGNEAAFNIISWDDAAINIEPLGVPESEEITMPLMHLLMESLKLKDEAALPQEQPPQPKGTGKAKRQISAKKPSTKRLVRLERAHAPVAPRKKLSFPALLGIAVGAFAIIAVIVVVAFHLIDNRNISDGYSDLLGRLEAMESPERRIEVLTAYVEKYPNSAYNADIQSRIAEAQDSIEEREFEKVTLSVSALPLDEHYESKSIELYRQFLERYPDSRFTEKVNQSVAEIKNLLDQYYYEELKRAAMLDFNKRLEAYRKYIAQFPSGKYRDDVEILINEMGEKYLVFLRDEAKSCEKRNYWKSCIEHAEKFITAYEDHDLARKAQALKTNFEDRRDYDQLVSSVEATGKNYQKAHQLFQAYLKDHPKTTQRKRIEVQLARLSVKSKAQRRWRAVEQYALNTKNDLIARIQKVDRYIKSNAKSEYVGDARSLLDRLEDDRRISLKRHRIESRKQLAQEKLQREREALERRKQRVKKFQAAMETQLEGSSRYRSNGDGTFTDLTTGLTWAILDSHQELAGCLTYDETLKYIRTLRLGGHRSWRLPTAYELAGINKKAPYFPASGASWYWSAETSVKGYHTVADIVTATQESKFHREQRDVTECGSVRAVLIPQP
jgi:outer membrane protein assembly factor BamD (BamD/ComL family)